MFLAAAIAAAVVLTGVDFVTIVLTSYAIRTAILIPLALALFWSRMTGLGLRRRHGSRHRDRHADPRGHGRPLGLAVDPGISAVVPLVIGLTGNRRYDFARLRQVRDATIVAPAE